MKSIISPQSTLLKNDTLDSRIYGLATIGYAYVKFVNNVGMVYLQSGASTAAIPYKTNNSTYTLKSYKLVTP
jgi:hypothetical protein